MYGDLLVQLETVITRKNPILARKLRPGLSEKEIMQRLDRAKIDGAIKPIIELYLWKNGTVFDRALKDSQVGMFPGGHYYFIEIKRAIVDNPDQRVSGAAGPNPGLDRAGDSLGKRQMVCAF